MLDVAMGPVTESHKRGVAGSRRRLTPAGPGPPGPHPLLCAAALQDFGMHLLQDGACHPLPIFLTAAESGAGLPQKDCSLRVL